MFVLTLTDLLSTTVLFKLLLTLLLTLLLLTVLVLVDALFVSTRVLESYTVAVCEFAPPTIAAKRIVKDSFLMFIIAYLLSLCYISPFHDID
jgi:hypothetical protein